MPPATQQMSRHTIMIIIRSVAVCVKYDDKESCCSVFGLVCALFLPVFMPCSNSRLKK